MKHRRGGRSAGGVVEERPVQQKPTLLPITFHDLVRERYPQYVHFAHLDACDRHEAGLHAPIEVSKEPCRLRLAIRTDSSMGTSWNGGRPVSFHPGHAGEKAMTFVETMEVKRHPDVIAIYQNMIDLGLSGERVYVLTDALVQRMLLTRMDLPVDLLRTPFRSFSFASSSETLVRTILGDERQGQYDRSNSVNVVVSMFGDDPSGPRRMRINTRLMRGRRLQETLQANLTLEPTQRLHDALRDFLKSASKFDLEDEDVIRIREGDGMGSWFGTSAEQLYRVLLNTIVYLSTSTAHLGPETVAGPKPMQAGPYTRLPIVYREVGGPLTPIHIRPVEAFVASRDRKGRPGSTLEKRILVPGHWRTWPGEKSLGDEARVMHIEPYWKGPKDAPVANRPYQVD